MTEAYPDPSYSAPPPPAAQLHSPTLYIPIVSPPTPAPSPRPTLSSLALSTPAVDQAACALPFLPTPPPVDLAGFAHLDPASRRALLAALLPLLTPPELLFVSTAIAPRLRRDFLRDLPTELALQVLSMVDDHRTLARAGCVSRAWRALVWDEGCWRAMCARYRFSAEGEEGEEVGWEDGGTMGKEKANTGIELDPGFSFRRYFRAEYTAGLSSFLPLHLRSVS
jgi:F-box and WD-40 domain protein CDC4